MRRLRHSKHLESGPCLLLIFYSNSHKVYTNAARPECIAFPRTPQKLRLEFLQMRFIYRYIVERGIEIRRRETKCDKAGFPLSSLAVLKRLI